MYIMVLHDIASPEAFWKHGPEILEAMPAEVKLHHTFSNPEGTQAVCIWEADSIDPVKSLLAPRFAGLSSDTYLVANNKEGVVLPPQFAPAPAAV